MNKKIINKFPRNEERDIKNESGTMNCPVNVRQKLTFTGCFHE